MDYKPLTKCDNMREDSFQYESLCLCVSTFLPVSMGIDIPMCSHSSIYLQGPSNLFPQTVATLKGFLREGTEARLLIEVGTGVRGIFPVNFHTKWLLCNVRVRFIL